jgi:hypothetical protein
MRQEWTWRDIFRSIGLAFSFTRLMIGFLGLVLFVAADLLMTNVIVQTQDIDQLHRASADQFARGVDEGVADVVRSVDHTTGFTAWVPDLLTVLRLVIAVAIFLFTATAIAYSAKGELLEGEGAGVMESLGFAFKKSGAVLWTPVLFWVFTGVMGGLAFLGFMVCTLASTTPIVFWVLFGVLAALSLATIVWALAAWTPEPLLALVGLVIILASLFILRHYDLLLVVSLCWYALTFLFTVLFAVLAMLGVLAFLFSLFLAPPIIATRQEGALDATLDSIDLMRGKGAFWGAILVLMVSCFIGVRILGKTMDVTYRVSNVVMGEEFRKMVVAMPEKLKPRARTLTSRAKIYWPGEYRTTLAEIAEKRGRDLPAPAGRLETGLAKTRAKVEAGAPLARKYEVSGWILGIWVLVIAGFLVSFTVGVFVSAATLTYLIVREEDEFFEPSTVELPPPAAKPAEEEADKDKKEEKKEKKAHEKKGSPKEDKKSARSKKSKRKKD